MKLTKEDREIFLSIIEDRRNPKATIPQMPRSFINSCGKLVRILYSDPRFPEFKDGKYIKRTFGVVDNISSCGVWIINKNKCLEKFALDDIVQMTEVELEII